MTAPCPRTGHRIISHSLLRWCGLVVLLVASLLAFAAALSFGSESGRVEVRRQTHFRISNPAALNPERAEAIYLAIRQRMSEHYAESGDPLARSYQNWRRLNHAPYRSAAHGDVFVNNYANASAAASYAIRDRATPFPADTIIVKDSFTVTVDGQVVTGSLYIIEKHSAAGDVPETAEWRFLEITPDGVLIGGSAGDRRTEFCAACHFGSNGRTAPFFFVPAENESRRDPVATDDEERRESR